jgi:hypothetical protein
MRIAQIAPLYESVPPDLYGGTERVISYLTEELLRQGHQVTSLPVVTQSPAGSWYPAAIGLFGRTQQWAPRYLTMSCNSSRSAAEQTSSTCCISIATSFIFPLPA